MTTSWIRLLLCLFTALAPLFAVAAEPAARIQGMALDADDMFRDSESQTVELNGHVQIASDDRHLQADHAKIQLRSKQLELTGHVRLTSLNSIIGGDRIVLDDESMTGVIYNGFVQSGSVMFEGAVIQKTGPDEFYVVDADYTTCTNCPASWSFKGSTIRAQLGGYAYIKNSVLNFGDVPVIWMPYLVVPLKSDRQSGLLTPGFENSRDGGLAISESYFWAISRNTDATVTLENYELRGMKGILNYRYVMDEHSSGEVNIGGLNDRAFIGTDRLRHFQSPSEQGNDIKRWFLRYNHYEELPDGWVSRAMINDASDLQYPKDFPTETLNFGDSAMESRLSMTKNTRDTHFSVDSSYYVNMLEANPMSSNEDAVHRLPEIRYAKTLTSLGDTGFYYNVDAVFTNFTRSGPAYDHLFRVPIPGTFPTQYVNGVANSCGDPRLYGNDPRCVRTPSSSYFPGDGVLPPDMIRTGQRLDFQPSLEYPMTLFHTIDLVPKVSYRETDYHFPINQDDVDDSNIRRYVRTEVASRVRFSRVYGDLINPKGTRYKHEIRPEVTYTNLPWIDHPSHPFFGTSKETESQSFQSQFITDADVASLSGLQFDYEDRIYDRNLLTYSLVNTLTEKKWINEMPMYKQIAFVRLSQSYDGWKSQHGKEDPLSDISALIDLRFGHFQSYSLFNYYPVQKVTNSAANLRVNDDMGRFVQAGVVDQYQIFGTNSPDENTRLLDYTFGGGFVTSYVNMMGKLTYTDARQAPDHMKAYTYIAEFKPPGNCWVIALVYNHVTGGDTTTNLNFAFTFDGKPKPPLPPETLDSYGF